MVEFVAKNKQEIKLKSILDAVFINDFEVNRQVFFDLDNFTSLGTAFYDSGFSGVLQKIPRDFFIRNFNTIFKFYGGGGRLEDYISYFKSLFGIDTTVDIEVPSNRVININVIANITNNQLVTDDGSLLVTDDGSQLVAGSLFPTLTKEQSIAVLNAIKPHEITLNINFN